jgi:hypothetical protein
LRRTILTLRAEFTDSAQCGEGINRRVDHMPSPDRAERNQQRKLAFIPVWPLIGAAIVVVLLVVLIR